MARFDFSDDAAAAWFDPARQHLQGADPPTEEQEEPPAEPVADAPPPPIVSEFPIPSEPAVTVEGLIIHQTPPATADDLPVVDEPHHTTAKLIEKREGGDSDTGAACDLSRTITPPVSETLCETDLARPDITAVPSQAVAVTRKGPVFIAPPVPCDERPPYAHMARDALAEHTGMLADCHAEIEEIELRLGAANVQQVIELTNRRRQLLDVLEHLERIMPRLQADAEQERAHQIKSEVNLLWLPAAEKRRRLLRELDLATDNLLAVLSDIEKATDEQHSILDKSRTVDRNAVIWQSDISYSHRYLIAFLARKLGIVHMFPETSQYIPSASSVEENQGRAVLDRIF